MERLRENERDNKKEEDVGIDGKKLEKGWEWDNISWEKGRLKRRGCIWEETDFEKKGKRLQEMEK